MWGTVKAERHQRTTRCSKNIFEVCFFDCQLKILYPVKISLRNKGKLRTISGKQQLKEFITRSTKTNDKSPLSRRKGVLRWKAGSTRKNKERRRE